MRIEEDVKNNARVKQPLSLSLLSSLYSSPSFFFVRSVANMNTTPRRGAAVMLTDMSSRQGNAREGVGGEVAKGLLALQWGNLP